MKKITLPIIILIALLVLTSFSIAAETPSVGFSVSTLSNPFFVSMRDAGEKRAEELGLNLTTLDAQDDVSKQVSQIQDLITRKVDVLIVNPVDSDAVGSAIMEANRAGIPVLTVTRPASSGEIVQHFDIDNKECGRKVGKKLVEDLNGEGKVAILEGLSGAPSAEDRQEGFLNALEDYEDLEVVTSLTANYSRNDGNNVTEDIMQSYPDLDAIYAHNDEMALGAIRALDAANKLDEVKVYGIDAVDDALNAIKNGEMAATIRQQPRLQMETAVESANKIIEGKELEKEVVLIPVSVVDAENVDEYLN